MGQKGVKTPRARKRERINYHSNEGASVRMECEVPTPHDSSQAVNLVLCQIVFQLKEPLLSLIFKTMGVSKKQFVPQFSCNLQEVLLISFHKAIFSIFIFTLDLGWIPLS